MRVLRTVGKVGLVLLVAVTVAALAWLRPYAAEPAAVAAVTDTAGDGVTVLDSPTRIRLQPDRLATDLGPATGVVFQPGALVDARAYVPLLLPIARAGHPVVVVKQPYGIAFLATGAVADVAESTPEVARWVAAGHSLGGTVAAMAPGTVEGVRGLLLWASYPASDISAVDVPVTSVSGSNDGLSTPQDIADSRADLPGGTAFVAVEGANHATFGDYGPQPGDGELTVPREQAQAKIVTASLELVRRVQQG